jgi:hypothetical protein
MNKESYWSEVAGELHLRHIAEAETEVEAETDLFGPELVVVVGTGHIVEDMTELAPVVGIVDIDNHYTVDSSFSISLFT